MTYDSIFNAKNKMAGNNNGQIFKFKEWTPGCQLAGVYLGSHTWQNDEGKDVLAFDFAKCTVDGVPQEGILTINQKAVLVNKLESVEAGQIMGIVFTGMGVAKGKKQAPYLFDFYIDPNQKDPDWESYLTSGVVPAKTANPVATAPVGQQPTEDMFDDHVNPLMSEDECEAKVKVIAKTKLGAVTDADVMVKVITTTGLPYQKGNFKNILTKLIELGKA